MTHSLFLRTKYANIHQQFDILLLNTIFKLIVLKFAKCEKALTLMISAPKNSYKRVV